MFREHNRRSSLTTKRTTRSLHRQTPSEGASVTAVKAIVRLRPLLVAETAEINAGRAWYAATATHKKLVIDTGREGPVSFEFDTVLGAESSQEEVFQTAGAPVVADVLGGFNGTIFAHGPTGGGKTYTMLGTDLYDPLSKGLIPRCASAIFQGVAQCSSDKEFSLSCSVLEIYQERLRDLLKVESVDLKIKEAPERGVYIDKLTAMSVRSERELLGFFELGAKMKTMAATKLNEMSSRSHCLFMVSIEQRLPSGSVLRGNLNLVDLAGSEKVARSGTTGTTFEETRKINLSLSALGNVTHALASNSPHVPYRDSKLTRLLSDSLGGNFKTSLIVNCSGFSGNIDEDLATLRFAQRAKKVQNTAKQNIRRQSPLNSEVNALKLQLAEAQDELKKHHLSTGALESEIERNEQAISQLRTEENRLKRELTMQKERCAAGDIGHKLTELKRSSEELSHSHFTEKKKTLLEQCAVLRRVAESAAEESTQLKVYSMSTVDLQDPLQVLTFHKQPVGPDLLERANKQMTRNSEIIQCEILREYMQNKQLALSCVQQQEGMRQLEVIIGKLRKQNRILRNNLYWPTEDAPLSSLEAALEVLKDQQILTEITMKQQTQLNSQLKDWASDLKTRVQRLNTVNP